MDTFAVTTTTVMKKYYVNKNAQTNTGDHEVHSEDCTYLPHPDHRLYLGEFSMCISAIAEAKTIYINSNGCKTCSNFCHTS